MMAEEGLTPILLAGGGRSGSTAIMSLLGSHSEVAIDRIFPYESRYLTLFAKFALLLQRPDFFEAFNEEQLMDLSYLGFGGHRPSTARPDRAVREQSIPREDARNWLRDLWRKFSSDVRRQQPGKRAYAEKAPIWLAPLVRDHLRCFTLYNVRDPRDIFISANAFIKKRNAMGFCRTAEDSDSDHARHLALAFATAYENYRADRDRGDVFLVRYEDFVLNRAAIAGKICRFAGLSPATSVVGDDESQLDRHRTAADQERSVERWRTEPIPEEVVRLFEQTLAEEMTALQYPVSLGHQPCRTIRFTERTLGLNPLIRISRHGYLKSGAEHALARIFGPDFHIYLPVDAFCADEVKEIWVCVQGDIGNHLSLYWRGRDTRFREEASIHIRYTPSPAWAIVSFRVHQHAAWKGEICKLRLDLFNNHTRPHRGIGRLRWVRFVF
jgi:hypothetical protein